MLPRVVVIAPPQFQLSEGGGQERILSEAIAVGYLLQRLDAALRAVPLSNGNRPAEGDDR